VSPFLKLDTAILDSTLWLDAAASRVFITALLMATPWETTEPLEQMEVRSLTPTGLVVPPGWYGFVPAAGIGIIRRALVPDKEGYAALEALGAPDEESRSHEFEGRRLVRVDGGFLVLNFMKFRDRDYGGAERQKRYRERKKALVHGDIDVTRVTRNATGETVSERRVTRYITQADADAEAEAETLELISESLQDSSPRANSGAPDPVEAIYQEYPRKVGKKAAITAIKRAVERVAKASGWPTRDAQAFLFKRTQSYARSPAGNHGEYTPHPATWFNQGRYDDDPQEWMRKHDERGSTTNGQGIRGRSGATGEELREILDLMEG
jgi:hypothetical protein